MNQVPLRAFRIACGAWRQRYIIVLPILLLPIIGFFVSVASPKKYTAHTSMLIQETAKMNPFLEDFAVSSMLKERMDALKTLLHSRHILSAVALEMNMLDEESSDEERDRVIAKLSSSLNMNMAGKDLIRIDFKSASPEGIKELLSALSKHFVEQLLAPERSSIADSTIFLSKHLTQKRGELNEAEQALAAFKAKHATNLPELHAMNIARLSQLKQKLAERKSELAGTVKTVGGLNQLLTETNPVVGRIEDQIVKIQGNLALLRARYSDRHSKVQAQLRTLRRLENERQNVLGNTKQLVDPDKLWDIASANQDNDDQQTLLISQLGDLQRAKNKADRLNEEISSLSSMIQEIEDGIAKFGKHENELSYLQRDLRVKRELYENLLQRHEMAEVTGSLGQFEQSKRIKIIDRPFTPSAPSNLPSILFVIAGLIGGIFLGSGMAVAIELSDTTIRSRTTLENIAGAPVISRIPPMAFS